MFGCGVVEWSGGEDIVLISRANLLSDRQGFVMGLARLGGPAEVMS